MFKIEQSQTWGQIGRGFAICSAGYSLINAASSAVVSQFPCCTAISAAQSALFGTVSGLFVGATSYLLMKGICRYKQIRQWTDWTRLDGIGALVTTLNIMFISPTFARLITNRFADSKVSFEDALPLSMMPGIISLLLVMRECLLTLPHSLAQS